MKKISSIILMISMFVLLMGADAEQFNSNYHYSNSLNICFSKEFLGNTKGNMEFSIENGIVKTPSSQLNQLFNKYQVYSLKKLYKVKDTNWNRNGIYPMNIFQIELKNENQIELLYKELRERSEFVFVEYNPIIQLSYTPNDPYLVSQWALTNIDAFRAWNYETGSASTIIGIVDSGVKWNHPDLMPNIWINTAEMTGVSINTESGEIVGGDGIDNDGNGYIDDIFGWDFYATGDNEDNNPYQAYNGNDHGTHVAGCAAAAGDNAVGVVGPAYNVKIMATKHQPSNYGTSYIYNGYQGIYYCADSGAHIINCSWGGRGGSDIANTAASYAKDHGALMICAASNDATDNTYVHYYPSDATDAVSVAATDMNDTKASFSNYGTPIDVSAPGVSILSTVYTMEGSNSYAGYQGTSMASPVAAGVAGLIKSMHPELTPMQLKERLQAGCDNIDSVNPQYVGKLGAGRVNAYNSLMYDKLPYVELIDYEVIETQGNNNAVVNPGENVQIKLNLKNRLNWLSASNLVLTLRSDNPMITITDSLININALAAGESIQSNDQFSFMVSNDFPVIQNANFKVIMNANQQNPYVYNDQFTLQIPVTCMRVNWPYTNETATYFSPVVDDINNDGEKEIIFNDNLGKVYVMNKNAVMFDGFPVSLNSVCYAPVSILQQASSKEIVVSAANKVYRISGNGQILSTFTAEGTIRITPLISDHNLDGIQDIVFATLAKKVYSLKNDGITINTNYPVSFDAATVSPIASGSGGVLYIANNNGLLHSISPDGALDQFAPFPYQYSGVSMNGPIVLSENAGVNESIIISGNRTNGNRISIIRKGNAFVTSISTSNSVTGGPIPVKNNDQTIFVYTTVDGKITCINGFGQILFEINCETLLDPSPVSVDINGDDTDEIMITSTNGTIRFYDISGQLISEKTINLSVENRMTPTISAIDEPNNIDILIPSLKKMNYLDTRIPFSSSDWPVYRGNNQRTGYVSNFPLAVDDNSTNAIQPFNISNYPNPFNPVTDIQFNLQNDTVCEINIYNVKGQLVEKLFSGNLKKGTHSLKWDAGKNRKAVSSGIYFCQFKSNEVTQIRKMLLLK